MILEIAQIDVKPGSEADFEAGIEKASALFKAAAGCRSFAVRRSVEKPQRYRLLIEWETLEAHTKDFTGSQPWAELPRDGLAVFREPAAGRAYRADARSILSEQPQTEA